LALFQSVSLPDDEEPLSKSFKGRSSAQKITFFVAVFACAIALIVYRDPSLFYSPRYWAEEGAVYYDTAYVSPFWVALLSPHQGYYSFWANIAGLLARLVPVESAPAVGTAMALVVTLAIIFAILINDARSLDTPLKKVVACLAAIVVSAAGEIWLTSCNSQHFMALLVFLALIDSKTSSAKRPFWYALAILAGLTSTAANFLTPLVLIKYWRGRQRPDLVLLMILCLTSALQVVAIVYSLEVMGPTAYYHDSQSRFSAQDHPDFIRVLNAIGYYWLVYPIFGFMSIAKIKHLGVIAAPLFVLNLFLIRRHLVDYWHFILAAAILVVLSTVASLHMQGGGRYAYAASVIIVIQYLAQATDERLPVAARALGGVFVVISLAYWSFTFRSSFLADHDPTWPSWSSEVAQWRQDPAHEIQIWPNWQSQSDEGLSWKVKLPETRSPPAVPRPMACAFRRSNCLRVVLKFRPQPAHRFK
jgi:hypothetical protein